MESESLRQRRPPTTGEKESTEGHGGEIQAVEDTKGKDGHPAGDAKHTGFVEHLRLVLVFLYSLVVLVSIAVTQFIGVPLYWINRDWYYAYMALTKQSFGIFIVTVTNWWAPTLIRISGDESVAGQLRKTEDGRVECDFPERLVLMANHQLYSDWLYMWWVAYTNQPQTHGHIYIILKESLKHIPIIGWGMQFYGFVFMSRKMTTDQPRLAHRLQQLKTRHSGPLSGTEGLDPMWLLIFPEGTNLSGNTRKNSVKWADTIGKPDMKHALMPRSTGSFFCLNELKGTVDYIYDCTIAYEGIPRGEYGQDIFTLRSNYLQGRPPKSVNMYWRRLAISSMPLDDPKEFDAWLLERWYEKDALIETYINTGRFPPSEIRPSKTDNESSPPPEPYIETEVKLADSFEVGNIFQVLAGTFMVVNVLLKIRSLWNGTAKESQFITLIKQLLWPIGDSRNVNTQIPGYNRPRAA